jgi:hypothetical protein
MFIKLKKGTLLYKGINTNNNFASLVPMWLSEDFETAKLYGSIVLTYKLEKDIILLSLTDLEFHNHFLNILNIIYTENDGADEKKIIAGLPLGLPNYFTQIQYLNSIRVKIIELENWNGNHEVYSQFLLNRHRYSTFERDKEMVKLLKKIYGNKCNGYISKIKWPSKLHDGYFNKELCLFDGTGLISLISSKGGKKSKKTQKGGEVIPGDSWNRMNHNITKEEMDKLDEKLFKNSNIDYVMENLDMFF